MKKIEKIFIANRGEICRRIAWTAKKLGIKTCCINDRVVPPSYLLGVIDEFIFVEEETVSLYLDASKMIGYAKQAGADAIHPGYGFLSENEFFAEQVLNAGLLWIGPRPHSIKAMAHKSEARELALKAGVPCLMGVKVPPDTDEKTLLNLAKKVSYPVLLKAAKGGGGKGMRIVQSSSELWEKAQQAFSEARNYFGDGTLLLERFVAQSRHIEVQILGDEQGNIVTVGDRDCSLQRRYQKIIEEAPALGLTEKTRKELYRCALLLSKEVGYSSCGTIEFLLDWTETSQKKEVQDFFFLEMNTRLQVEHPVTETIFGLDLVEWQIRVCRGEVLPKSFQDLEPRGHALEARLYAEDPSQNFFPSPGKVFCFLPAQGWGVRWDLGIDTVDEISTKFDPMFGKLIVYGESRELAINGMIKALQESFFAGPINNLDFLEKVLIDVNFQRAPIDTSFLKTWIYKVENQNQNLGTSLLQKLEDQQGSFLNKTEDAGADLRRKILAIFSKQGREKSSKNELIQIAFENSRYFSSDSSLKIIYGQGTVKSKDGAFQSFFYTSTSQKGEKNFYLKVGGHCYSQTRKELKSTIHSAGAVKLFQNQIVSPVPGRVLKILIQANELVEEKQSLFVLDSMKMEFVIVATAEGKVHTLNVQEGDQVDSGQVLAEFKASSN